jgi:hypothetical protein
MKIIQAAALVAAAVALSVTAASAQTGLVQGSSKDLANLKEKGWMFSDGQLVLKTNGNVTVSVSRGVASADKNKNIVVSNGQVTYTGVPPERTILTARKTVTRFVTATGTHEVGGKGYVVVPQNGRLIQIAAVGSTIDDTFEMQPHDVRESVTLYPGSVLNLSLDGLYDFEGVIHVYDPATRTKVLALSHNGRFELEDNSECDSIPCLFLDRPEFKPKGGQQ